MDRIASRLLWNVAPTALVGVILYTAVCGENGYLRQRELQVRLKKEALHLAVVKGENAALAREVERLRTDRASQMRAAAEDLLLVPEHSTVFRFPVGTP